MRFLSYEISGFKKGSLAGRIAFLIVILSSCLTLLATAVQLYIGYRWDLSAIDERMEQVAKGYVNSIAQSVWSFDEEQIISLLQGITTLPDIELAEVSTTDGQNFTHGRAPDPKYRLIREYPIIYPGTDLPSSANPRLGMLRVTANLEGVYLRLIDKFLLILGTNAVKTLPFSILLFLIFRSLVTRHLDAISSYMLRVNLNHLTEELVLNRRSRKGDPDELELLARSINGMRQSLLEKVKEQGRAETERKSLIEQLQESLKVRDEFLAIASHELRTPLTPLWIHFRLTQRLLLRLKLEDNPEVARVLASFFTLESQLSRLTTLVENLLDISQIQSGTFELRVREQVDLGAIARQVSEQYRPSLEKAGCQFEVEIEGMDLRVKGDSDRLGQVIGNLLSNAAKYGFGKPVRLTVSKEPGWIKMTVRDHGVGISLEDQKRMFGLFERAVSFKSFGGFGLSLYISKEIIRLHGGSMSVDSSPGEGALFSVWIPLQNG